MDDKRLKRGRLKLELIIATIRWTLFFMVLMLESQGALNLLLGYSTICGSFGILFCLAGLMDRPSEVPFPRFAAFDLTIFSIVALWFGFYFISGCLLLYLIGIFILDGNAKDKEVNNGSF